ncbi:TetR/AcrR family transcriptional regulator [Solitalea canadensis]|uniref:Transcriptional regulator n=1 Tax=Solitalea canadensis (strain ATCC 29591 / DSM 3403 / JCM 21819 / LMG 8368 / NBRC 15130 / NCIMB 12057 / USAM 9D) TaxID=929556 RepID=H8KPN0_SOLCM|nr:TetR/AcrR family transcriptional regulator [Solitalea canadensis]AFD05928.1 transcriptional regulator [Solitalea canadensis DSM 3403]
MVKERIIETAEKLFTTFGVKSVSMDDISVKAGVSKRTIYEQYKDKSSLVSQLMNHILMSYQSALEKCKTEANDAIEENFIALKYIEQLALAINPSFTYDIKKYHSEIWKEAEFFRSYILKNMIRDNIERGIKEGWFNENINIDIMTDLRLLEIDALFNATANILHHKKLQQVALAHTIHFMRGLATIEGVELIEHYTHEA